MFAASLLEGAECQGRRAVFFQVPTEVFPGNAGYPTLVGARDRVAWTLVLMILGVKEILLQLQDTIFKNIYCRHSK